MIDSIKHAAVLAWQFLRDGYSISVAAVGKYPTVTFWLILGLIVVATVR